MDRALYPSINRDRKKRIVLISGPRQAGKTTLARGLSEDQDYLNFDNPEDREMIRQRTWNRRRSMVIFDEMHKMEGWKSFLKGVYDTEGIPPSLVVTGSAQMEAFQKMGDSLAGRFFSYRLHPLDIREVRDSLEPRPAMERILRVGGFPEPFLENNETFYRRWKKTHQDVILRQDMLDLTAYTDIQKIETLVELLRHRVGSPVSYASLARDLQRDPQTVKSWLLLLEGLYVIFPVRPWHRNVARSLLKEPKYYFFDAAQPAGEEGSRLENLAACSLYKWTHHLQDTQGIQTELHYLRTRDKKELDFVLSRDGVITHAYEVKTSDTALSRNFNTFSAALGGARRIQLVANPAREKPWPPWNNPPVHSASRRLSPTPPAK